MTGGILAPLCLAFGIKLATAFEVTLLLNFETVATTAIAFFVFHEQVGKSVWFGKALIVIGAILIGFQQGHGYSFSTSAKLIVLACIFWGRESS